MSETKNEPMVLCENLIKIYKTKDSEVLALQGLDLVVERGELMALIGSSGSGKSTFLNMIGGLDHPSAGSLYVDGKNLFKMTEEELVEYKRSTVGFVWQNNARNLLPYLTAEENVQLPMMITSQKKRRERAIELMEAVGIAHKRKNKLRELSGGEQQRIAIAIALANSPKLLLADEPTGAVDSKTSHHIMEVFRELNRQGLTIIIVTHDPLLQKQVNRAVSIRDGKISREMITKESFRDRLDSIGLLEDTQEEFAVLDRAGRVQIPKEVLESMGISGHKVRLTHEDGKIIITAADSE
jgi:ABC-type lipoprotein export system ATPase subunit